MDNTGPRYDGVQLFHAAGVLEGRRGRWFVFILARMLQYPYSNLITGPYMGAAPRIFSKQSFDHGASELEEGQYLPLHSHTTTSPSGCDVSGATASSQPS